MTDTMEFQTRVVALNALDSTLLYFADTKPTRNQIALSYDEIEKDLEKECGCADRCQKKFSPEEIIYWRYKVHTLPIGDKRMDKIKELLKMSSLSLTKHERNQQFKVSQHYCCR